MIAAQLIVNSKNLGLHWFVVQLRDVDTYLALPGVTVGDIGPKAGWNGVDNGFVLFNKVKLPKTALLNRYQDINEKGEYYSKLQDPSKRFALTLVKQF